VGARFSAPVQTGPGAHPASYTMGTVCFPGVKRQGRGVDHPPPSNAELRQYSDWLRAGRSGDRTPVGARFSAPVQTGPGAHPAFYTMGTGSFPGVNRPGRGVDHPPPSSAEVKERI
jgi:hypothetical protein